ncbi:MAG: PqqD family peptide modification chaperone [Gammaproteobacteria bacterium]
MLSQTSLVFPLPNNSISSHIIDDELIVFDARSRQLVRLNETATQIWKIHENNVSPEDIASELSVIYGLKKEELLPDIVTALNEWYAMGMLGDEHLPTIEEEADVLGHLKKSVVNYEDKQDLISVKEFTFLDAGFVVMVSSDELKDIVLPLFSHLEKADNKTTHKIKVIEEKSSYIILDNDMELGRTNKLEEVAPIVNAHVLVAGFLEVDCLSVFHSGVVYDNDGVVLLSAGSGSGKSTLTAALMCSGKNFFTDELAILTCDKKIRPAPGCIGLKKGSWDVIEEFYPDIFELATHERQDDKVVKYVPPTSSPPSIQQQKQGEEVRAIVFPNYSPECQSTLTEISAADALVKITDAGYHTNQTLNHESVAQLVEWIIDIPAYELKVNNLKEAVNLVSGLF